MARNRDIPTTVFSTPESEEHNKSVRRVADDLERYRPTRRDKKDTIKTHVIHEYRDKESRYQLTRGLRPWAKRSLGIG